LTFTNASLKQVNILRIPGCESGTGITRICVKPWNILIKQKKLVTRNLKFMSEKKDRKRSFVYIIENLILYLLLLVRRDKMKEKKCPVCEIGNLVKVEDILSEIDGYIFVKKGERCSHCGEEFVPEEEGERMIKIARKLQLWGEPLKLYRKLSRSARGIVLRIPTDIEKNLKIHGDEEISISKVGKNKILIEVDTDS
jgi:hypothetical protein